MTFQIHQYHPIKDAQYLVECERIERRLFPKHESLANDLKHELKRKGTLCFLALEASSLQVCGYVILSKTRTLRHYNMIKLAVKSNRQRQGIGTLLIEWCQNHKDIHSLQLHVDPCRLSAVSLYEAKGFQKVSYHANFYSSKRHAYLYYWTC